MLLITVIDHSLSLFSLGRAGAAPGRAQRESTTSWRASPPPRELRGAEGSALPPLQGSRARDRERRDAVQRAAQGQRDPTEKRGSAAFRTAQTPLPWDHPAAAAIYWWWVIRRNKKCHRNQSDAIWGFSSVQVKMCVCVCDIYILGLGDMA